MEYGFYWMKEEGQPWVVVEISQDQMYFTGSDICARRADGGPWEYPIFGSELKIEQLVKIEPPNA